MFEKITVCVYLALFSKLINGQDIYFPNDKDESTFAKELITGHQRDNAEGNLEFSLLISRILREFHPYSNENVVFSPLSISMILAVIALGTKGRTRNNILELLNKENDQSFSSEIKELFQDPSIKLANAIFKSTTFPLSKNFLEDVKNLYSSELLNVNFSERNGEAKNFINSWVYNKTNGFINDILPLPPPKDTKIIIGNALYFSAEWETKFITGATEKKPFYSRGSFIMLPTMATGGVFPYFNDPILNCEIVGLPYQGNATIMYIILPSKESSLEELESKLSKIHLQRLISNSKYRGVIVSLPKMNLEQSVDLKSTLKRLNLNSVFNEDPTNMDAESLRISDALHKSNINVTETGTVAASSTLVTLTRDGSRISFKADRSFLFVIYHKQTQLVLFWASIAHPNT